MVKKQAFLIILAFFYQSFIKIICRMTPKLTKSEQIHLQDKKNIKNIYVHKINSLMKLSRDSLLKQEMEMSHNPEKKKIKKVVSEVDKITIKLQKNRESAKKARLRKKLYIKLLQSQVDHFKRLQIEGERLLCQSGDFIKKQKNRVQIQKKSSSNQIDLDKYLSNQNLRKALEEQNNEFEQKINRSTKIAEQICQLTTNTLLKKVCYIKNFQTLVPILIDKSQQQQLKMKGIVKKIFLQHQNLRRFFIIKLAYLSNYYPQTKLLNKFLEIQDNNAQMESFSLVILMKNTLQQLTSSVNQQFFLPKQNLNSEVDSNQMEIEQKTTQIYINVHQSQKLAIRAQKYLQITNFKSQERSDYTNPQI